MVDHNSLNFEPATPVPTTSDSEPKNTEIRVDELMEEIRNRVRQRLQSENEDALPKFSPLKITGNSSKVFRAGHLVNSVDLNALNQFFARSLTTSMKEVTTHRRGIIGYLIKKGKSLLRKLMWDLLQDHFQQTREFDSALVRYLNDVSRYVDARDAANFWELIHKIDVDTQKCVKHLELLNDEIRGRELERSRSGVAIGGVTHNQLQEVVARLEGLDAVVLGLESIIALKFSTPLSSKESDYMSDKRYLLLENRFRGSEEIISERLKPYLEILQSTPNADLPFLDLGAGRGEFVSLLKESNLNAYGIDIDKAMVEHAQNKGLDVRLDDGLNHLFGLSPKSIRSLTATQVVEHLTQSQLEELLRLASLKIAPGGIIILETINPKSLLALSSNYFRDPTHVFPCHPDTLSYNLSLAGFINVQIKYLSPVPEESLLKLLPIQDYFTPSEISNVRAVNRNIEQLNELLYGYQEYFVIGEVPKIL
jgi:O-antigen chain-terminating methyltransferase